MARLGIIDIETIALKAIPDLWEKYLPDCIVLRELEVLGQVRTSGSSDFRRFEIECDEFDELANDEPVPFYTFWFQEVRGIDSTPLGSKLYGKFHRLPAERQPQALAAHERIAK